MPKNCDDILNSPNSTEPKPDGIYEIYADSTTMLRVYCEMFKGGWTRIMNRVDNSLAFNRSMNDYEEGFGPLKQNHWLGLKYMRKLVMNQPTLLRVELFNDDDDLVFVEYEYFHINPKSDSYKLSVGDRVYGDLTEYLGSYHNDMKFSTFDKDNDEDQKTNCALANNGGWWFRNCYFVCLTCKDSSLGQWLQSYSSSANYANVKMMIKPMMGKRR